MSTFREALAIDEAFRGPFGKWLKEEFKTQLDAKRAEASRICPENLHDQNERADLLAQSNLLEDLLTQIPSKIEELVKETKKQELKNE